ncbi:hypothetical protein RLOatenuis_3120 [Rickettsiales bacterium]|nr:hypothetical protein RLOatenuis_3120 [Rickettsiales bacterium]
MTAEQISSYIKELYALKGYEFDYRDDPYPCAAGIYLKDNAPQDPECQA